MYMRIYIFHIVEVNGYAEGICMNRGIYTTKFLIGEVEKDLTLSKWYDQSVDYSHLPISHDLFSQHLYFKKK